MRDIKISTEYSGRTTERVKPRTYVSNGDRIRAMSDEELDKFLGEVQWDVANYCGGLTEKQVYPVPDKRGDWLEWLKQESRTEKEI